MRIEISAGGLSGGVGVLTFQSGIKSYISKADNVISSFKAVSNKTYNLNGNVGNLADAVNEVNVRIRTEENRKSDAENVQRKANDFLNLAIRVDKNVASMVNQNREILYGKYPNLRPSPGQWVKDWLSKAWEGLCKTGHAIAKGVSSVANTIAKIASSIINFLQNDKVWEVIKAAATGVICACAAIFFLPEVLAGIGITGIAAGIICAIFAVSSAISLVLNIGNILDFLDDSPVLQKVRVVTTALANIGFFLSTLSLEKLLEGFAESAIFISKYVSAQKAIDIASRMIKLTISFEISENILQIGDGLFNFDNNALYKAIHNLIKTINEIVDQISQLAAAPPEQLNVEKVLA